MLVLVNKPDSVKKGKARKYRSFKYILLENVSNLNPFQTCEKTRVSRFKFILKDKKQLKILSWEEKPPKIIIKN